MVRGAYMQPGRVSLPRRTLSIIVLFILTLLSKRVNPVMPLSKRRLLSESALNHRSGGKMATQQCLAIDAYHVGIVCALPDEMTAARAMLDEEHAQLHWQKPQDHNSYTLGRMGQHNIVIACLPAGRDGTNAAATVARDMLRTFTDLRIGLMVGIGGGIPDPKSGRDIRLGDVVVSQPDGTLGGVVQYDKGKALGKGIFVRKSALNSPPTPLLTALVALRSDRDFQRDQVQKFLEEAYLRHPSLQKQGYMSPGQDTDRLHCASCRPSRWWWILWLLLVWLCPLLACQNCDRGEVRRPRRDGRPLHVHYGTIASGNKVIKDSSERDRLGQEFGALCVEMEAAGLMNDYPCIVIRGICDYADSRKNDAWQKYAAITAAACAKDLLRHVNPGQTTEQQRIQDVVGILNDQLHVNQEILAETQRQNLTTVLHYEHEKHRRCHQAFKTCSYESFKDFNRSRAEGTCRWVLTHPQYAEWHSSTQDGLLWISADPGCGKSVLAKSLVDRELCGSAMHSTCYFFFKDNDEQDHVATALCAILHQLFAQQPRLVRHALDMWEKNGDKMQQEVSELWRTLLAAARDDDAHDITCILDALDECRPADRKRLIEMLARFHADRRPSSSSAKGKRGGRLKFLVTSRPYDDIELDFERTLRDLPTIRLRGEEKNDQIRDEINAVVCERVASLAHEFRLKEPVRARLEEKLLEIEHRTYLWLHLALDSFSKTLRNSLRPEYEAIEMLPTGVDDAYEKILGRVTKDQRGIVRKTLQIVVGSRRALTVPEMAIALGIATEQRATILSSLDGVRLDSELIKRRLSRWCGLFLFINHDRIYLIHQTAKEFLLSDSRIPAVALGWKHCLDTSQTEEQLCRLYVNFLSLEDVRVATRGLSYQVQSRFSLLDEALHNDDPVQSLIIYAAEYWPSHLRAGSFIPDAAMTFQLSHFYNTTSKIQPPWFSIYWKGTEQYEERPKATALQLAAMLGDEQSLVRFMGHGFQFNVNDRDHFGRTALFWACRYGHKKIMQMLLDKGADVNAQGGHYGTALQAASAEGHSEIVQMLVDKGADVNAEGGECGTALQAASERGHSEIMQILLDKGADVNAQGGFYDNALQAASAEGHSEIVQILLDKGADVNVQGGFNGSTLQTASARGHSEIVQILLGKGADVNTQGGFYGTALQAASAEGHSEIVQMLLDQGADVNTQGGHYGTALQAASAEGHSEIVQMLLDTGADVNAQGGHYGTALQAASARGYSEIMQILLGKGADVNAQGGFYGNALQAALKGGYSDIMQMLLDKGADVNAQGGRHGTVLQTASARGYSEIVQILLGKGADVNTQGGFYGNALQAASEGGYSDIMQMLLDKGADVNTQGGHYGTALQAASARGYSGIVQILLDKGADVNAQGGVYGNALQAASARGYSEIVQILLDKGADVNAQGEVYGNALRAASERGHTKVVQMLLDTHAKRKQIP